MKKLSTLILLFLLCSLLSLAQTNNVTITHAANTFTISAVQMPIRSDFTKPIIFTITSPPTGFTIQAVNGETSAGVLQGDGSYHVTVTNPSSRLVHLKIVATGYQSLDFTINNFSQPNPVQNKQAVLSQLTEYNNPFRYNRKRNEAYFFFDEKGMLLGPAPVNVDADDYIVSFIIVPQSEASTYNIQVEGEYRPTDLLIRPSETIASGAAQGTGGGTEKYVVIKQTFGPFTSDDVTIKVFKDEVAIKQYITPINKLYNIALGASFVSTNLANPDYEVSQISGTTNNTIRSLNDGVRTMVTFNVIFYWKSTIDWASGKLSNSGHITRGRDILKEATFWERLNPTFGVALNGDWKENFFMGGNFEFARGGSITAGWHYGRTNVLVDRKFKIGEDIFQGTNDDILITNEWKWGGFVGLTVDTRIFNRLFSRN